LKFKRGVVGAFEIMRLILHEMEQWKRFAIGIPPRGVYPEFVEGLVLTGMTYR